MRKAIQICSHTALMVCLDPTERDNPGSLSPRLAAQVASSATTLPRWTPQTRARVDDAVSGGAAPAPLRVRSFDKPEPVSVPVDTAHPLHFVSAADTCRPATVLHVGVGHTLAAWCPGWTGPDGVQLLATADSGSDAPASASTPAPGPARLRFWLVRLPAGTLRRQEGQKCITRHNLSRCYYVCDVQNARLP